MYINQLIIFTHVCCLQGTKGTGGKILIMEEASRLDPNVFMETIAHHPEHTRPLSEFFADAANGNLPTFSWINPSSGINLTTGIASNDQHPDHDMAAGEQYYKAVYEALRAGPGWNDTLFILTYDVRAPSSKWLPIRPGPSCSRRA